MSIPKAEILSQGEAAQRAGISSTTLRGLEESGEFPIRIHLTEKRIAYLGSEVDKWIAWRISERDRAAQSQEVSA